jgi:hypothetical protein
MAGDKENAYGKSARLDNVAMSEDVQPDLESAADMTLASSALVSASHGVDQQSVLSDFNLTHPSFNLSR